LPINWIEVEINTSSIKFPRQFTQKSSIARAMTPSNNTLFRQKALDHASSPEQLDRMIQLVQLHHWIPLAVMGSLVAAGAVWSVVGAT
jgi:hypothetical protein